MANVSVGWEVEGIISTEESVASMLKVISTKTFRDTGRFFTWEGKVNPRPLRNPSDKQSYLQNLGASMVAHL